MIPATLAVAIAVVAMQAGIAIGVLVMAAFVGASRRPPRQP